MIHSLIKSYILFVIFTFFYTNIAFSQNIEKIEWQTNDELNKYTLEDFHKIIEGKWLFVYKSCPWSTQEATKIEEIIIEFSKEDTAFFWYKNKKSDDKFSWKIVDKTNGWFTLDFKASTESELLISPLNLKGIINISKDSKYISFSNNIEIDGGCLECFEKVKNN